MKSRLRRKERLQNSILGNWKTAAAETEIVKTTWQWFGVGEYQEFSFKHIKFEMLISYPIEHVKLDILSNWS